MSNTLEPGPDPALPPTEPRQGRADDRRTVWVVLGLVAVVAIVALVYVFSQNNSATQQAALDQATASQQAHDAAQTAGNAAAAAGQSAVGAAGSAAGAAADQAARSAPVSPDQAGRASQPPNPAPPADNGQQSSTQGAATSPPGQ
jgi:hypothetical protein